MARRKTTKPMVHHLAITKARHTLGEVIRRVHRGKEYVVLEKGGLPVAAIMDIDAFEDYLELFDPEVNRSIAESAAEHRAGESRPLAAFIDQLDDESSDTPS